MKPEPLQLDSRNAHSKLQIGDRLVVGDGVGGLMDQVRSVQPEDVHTQDLTRVLPAG